MTVDHPAAEALLSIIRNRITSHPRSQQVRIGPSEIGHPCTRWLGYKLAMNGAEVNPRSAGWRPTVGTAVHSWLAKTFQVANRDITRALGRGEPLWLVEHRLACGAIEAPDGYEVFGSCDLYDAVFRCVIDWKIVGKTTLDDARRKVARGEPTDAKYRIQSHTYGRGWQRLGLPVDEVAIFYLPASGELTDAVWWSEPYDESVVTAALERVSAVQTLVTQHGLAGVALLPTVDQFCHKCEFFRPGSTDLTVACPGDEGRTVRPDPIETLISRSTQQ